MKVHVEDAPTTANVYFHNVEKIVNIILTKDFLDVFLYGIRETLVYVDIFKSTLR